MMMIQIAIMMQIRRWTDPDNKDYCTERGGQARLRAAVTVTSGPQDMAPSCAISYVK